MLALCALLAGCTPPSSAQDVTAVPVRDAAGQVTQLQTRVCRPAGQAPARLVVIAHGSPPNPADRTTMQLRTCDEETTRWFTGRGYVVAYALRRGYGATGGPWAEAPGDCAQVDYVHAGTETARDIAAVVDALAGQPGIRGDGVVVVGQSAGGWGTVALDSQPHPKVSGFVSMAGGRGGHLNRIPNQNCRPDRLAEAAGQFGATATTPMLWVYAANDSFFSPAIARDMHDRFTAAGGRADLQTPGPFRRDGHALFFAPGGSAIWGPLVAAYLDARG